MSGVHDLSGRQVGRYRVLSLIGEGGMGAVYEASDPDLRRVVALKILPPELVADRARLQRFTQEARAASALNHPHVVAVYEVGTQQLDDLLLHYIAMERVEGCTLRERLATGGLPLRKTLELMAQVADAVGAAHAAGIVHRDLKPENIMVTNAGYAKVLDFGLAKLRDDGEIHDDDSTRELSTASGAILGTIGYMSPEQAHGRPADARSDIFALGCILYEAVTGRRAFKGTSPVDTLHAIIHVDPEPVHVLAPHAPPELRRVIRKALAKDPDARFQSAKDLAIDLRELARDIDGAVRPDAAPPLRRTWRGVIPLLIAGISVIALTAVLISSRRQQSLRTKTVFQIPPPNGLMFSSSFDSFAVSPDGTAICFVGLTAGGSSFLYLRRLDSAEVRKVDGTANAAAPFWSPDSKWIGYSASGRMWKTRATDGTSPVPICLVPSVGVVASWGRGTILFAHLAGGRREILRVSDAGGTPVPATRIGDGEWRHMFPRWFADGEHFLYLAIAKNSIERNVVLASTRSAERTVILRGALKAIAIRNERVLYAEAGKVLAQQVDLRKRAVLGDPVPVADDVHCLAVTGDAQFSASETGVLIYRTNTGTGRLALLNRKGSELRVFSEQAGLVYSPSLSPDGRKAAVTHAERTTGFGDIWIYDVAQTSRKRLTSDPGLESYPVWTPDGQSIVYSTVQGGDVPHLVRQPVEGGLAEQLLPPSNPQIARSFSPDGSTLFYARIDPRTGSDMFRLDVATRWTGPVFSSDYPHSSESTYSYSIEPEVSSSGTWLAFSKYSSGRLETYVHNLSSAEHLRSRISKSGGRDPRWRGDAAELFYLSDDSRTVRAATPRKASQWNDPSITELFRSTAKIVGYDVSKDGQSFLISTWTPGAADASLHVIVGAN